MYYSGKMFIKRTKTASGGKTYTYLQLVESIRKDGRSTHRVLANLGREDQVDPKQIDRLIAALAPYGEGQVLTADGLRIQDAREYGTILALDAIWQELELDRILAGAADGRRFGFDVEATIRALVMSRILEPGSDKGILSWRDQVYLPELAQLQLQHLYRGLDFLTEIKEQLESSLLQVLSRRLLVDLNLVLFDTTSVYFEGDGPGELAKRGYSRDRRSDRPQVILGLLTTADGLPLSHVVLPGNTADPKSLRQAMALAARHLPISRMILVMDRGMVSEEGLKQLEAMGLEYIAGLRYRQLVTRDALRRGGRYRKVADNLLVKEAYGGPRRLVICYNPQEATRDRATREEMVRYLEAQLAAKGIKGLMKNRAAKRYLTVESQNASINRKRIAQDRANDGKWVLVTNTSLPAEDVALAYKGLWQVERAFRTLKTPLEIRPVYHWADRRVLGHIAACVLAYLLEKVLERKLAAAGLDLSADTALAKLRRLRAATVRLGSKEFVLPTEADEEQEAILRACGAQLPTRLQTA